MTSLISHRQPRRHRRTVSAVLMLFGALMLATPAWSQDCVANPDECGSDPGAGAPPVTVAPPTSVRPGAPTVPTVAGTPTTLTVPTTATTLPGSGTPTTPGAGTGTPTSSPASVNPTSVAPGQSITVSGSGFMASQTLSITLDSAAATPASTVASAAGAFSVLVTVPGTITAGSHTVTVTGRNPQGGQHQSVGTFNVTLAQTGAGETIAMTIAGMVLIGVGYRLVERIRWTRPVSTTGYRGR